MDERQFAGSNEGEAKQAKEVLSTYRDRTLQRLDAIVRDVLRLRHFARRKRAKLPGFDGAGLEWERHRWSLENDVFAGLPDALRDALQQGDTPFEDGWVLMFKPRSTKALEGIDPATKKDIEERGGWEGYVHRCTRWDVEYPASHPPPYTVLTARRLLLSSEWIPDWGAAQRAYDSAKRAFDMLGALEYPSARQLETAVEIHVFKGHPKWLPEGEDELAEGIKRALLIGLYAPPTDLEDEVLVSTIEARFWPYSIRSAVQDVLASLVERNVLAHRNLEYRPAGGAACTFDGWYFVRGEHFDKSELETGTAALPPPLGEAADASDGRNEAKGRLAKPDGPGETRAAGPRRRRSVPKRVEMAGRAKQVYDAIVKETEDDTGRSLAEMLRAEGVTRTVFDTSMHFKDARMAWETLREKRAVEQASRRMRRETDRKTDHRQNHKPL